MPLIDDEGLNIIRHYVSGTRIDADDPATDDPEGMPDRCIIGVWVKGTRDDMGQTRDDWTYGDEIPCRFHLIASSSQEEIADNADVATGDATVHVPLGITVNKRDRIRLTKKWNLPVTPQDYEIVGAFAVNAADITIHLSLITNVVG